MQRCRPLAASTIWSTTPRSSPVCRLDPLIAVDLDYYQRFMSINMNGALVMTRAVLPYMRRQGGAIVNQTSTAAHMAYGMYSVAKYGSNGLTFALARELGPSGYESTGSRRAPPTRLRCTATRPMRSSPRSSPRCRSLALARPRT